MKSFGSLLLLFAWSLLCSCGTPLAEGWPHAEPIEGEPALAVLLAHRLDDRASACDALCALTTLHCKQEKRAYPSFADCMRTCPLIPQMGSPGDTSGDTVHCRLTYALLAEQTLTLWFCQNASAPGGLQCR